MGRTHPVRDAALIGGPPADVAAIYAAIPGSQPVTVQGQTYVSLLDCARPFPEAFSYCSGYYGYPCATRVNLTMIFGGQAISILDVDFNAGQSSTRSDICLGAFFEVETSPRSPNWVRHSFALRPLLLLTRFCTQIIGAVFIKNVCKSLPFAAHSTRSDFSQ